MNVDIGLLGTGNAFCRRPGGRSSERRAGLREALAAPEGEGRERGHDGMVVRLGQVGAEG
jgi:hypothetical protein